MRRRGLRWVLALVGLAVMAVAAVELWAEATTPGLTQENLIESKSESPLRR